MENLGIILIRSQARNLWGTELCKNSRNSRECSGQNCLSFAIHRTPWCAWSSSWSRDF